MSVSLPPLTLAVHTVGRSAHDELIADVRAGLGSNPKTLPPRWFYDARGSELFDRITELPEYYQTRTEASILCEHAVEIATSVAAENLVELGAGTCTKSRILLDALRGQGKLTTFTPFDVSEEVLRRCSAGLLDEYPGISVYAMVGDFADHLGYIPRLGRRLVAFLGSTIGNLDADQRRRFLADVRGLLAPGDAFLCGLDLIKDPALLVAAYDDSAGVTAEFNRNVLGVINRELGADFDVHAFEHVARYDTALDRIEMHLRSRTAQTVRIPGADMTVSFAAGETMRTEISCKFSRALADELLDAASMRAVRWFSDPEERFALVLAVPV